MGHYTVNGSASPCLAFGWLTIGGSSSQPIKTLVRIGTILASQLIKHLICRSADQTLFYIGPGICSESELIKHRVNRRALRSYIWKRECILYSSRRRSHGHLGLMMLPPDFWGCFCDIKYNILRFPCILSWFIYLYSVVWYQLQNASLKLIIKVCLRCIQYEYTCCVICPTLVLFR
jgi:hypothetical protein